MTVLPFIHPSDEAHWKGVERVWASVQQYPPKKSKPVSSWWLVAVGLVLVAVAVRAGL